jgi:hypothetical protein
MTCCGSVVPARAISWRCVQKVDAPIPTTMTKATEPDGERLGAQVVEHRGGAVEGGADRGAEDLGDRALLQLLGAEPELRLGVGLEVRMTVNSAKNTGSCSSSGRHPEMGLALFSL